MFRRKSKKGIELISISKRTENEKPEPKTSSELKAKRRAIRSKSFYLNSKKTEPLPPLEGNKEASQKPRDPIFSSDSAKTPIKFVSPIHQQTRSDAKLNLVLANSDKDTEEPQLQVTRMHTSRFTMKIAPNGMSHTKTNGKINYRHSTYVKGTVPVMDYQLKKDKSQQEEKIVEEKEDETVQTMNFEDPSDKDKTNSLPRDRTSTIKSMFDVSYEL